MRYRPLYLIRSATLIMVCIHLIRSSWWWGTDLCTSSGLHDDEVQTSVPHQVYMMMRYRPLHLIRSTWWWGTDLCTSSGLHDDEVQTSVPHQVYMMMRYRLLHLIRSTWWWGTDLCTSSGLHDDEVQTSVPHQVSNIYNKVRNSLSDNVMSTNEQFIKLNFLMVPPLNFILLTSWSLTFNKSRCKTEPLFFS